MFTDKNVLITGGTGSLGSRLLHRILHGDTGMPAGIHIFSRDEDKQHRLRIDLRREYPDTWQRVHFWLGDVRDPAALEKVVPRADIILCLAALKQVPNCEYFPGEAVNTNVLGIANLIRAIRVTNAPVETVVGISTDKACKPINVMGMTKALQEKMLIQANLECPGTRFVIARYGNVLDSRGSILPLFRECVRNNQPLPVTHPGMTRFLMTQDEAIDTVLATLREAAPGQTFVPRIASGYVEDLARAMIGGRDLSIEHTGQRPGEKIHEILVSLEESARLSTGKRHFIIHPQFPELNPPPLNAEADLFEYSSRDSLVSADEVRRILEENGLIDAES